MLGVTYGTITYIEILCMWRCHDWVNPQCGETYYEAVGPYRVIIYAWRYYEVYGMHTVYITGIALRHNVHLNKMTATCLEPREYQQDLAFFIPD